MDSSGQCLMKALHTQEVRNIHIQHWRGQRVSVGIALRQRLQQHLGLLEVGGVKAFGEPAIDRGKQRPRFVSLPLLVPQASETSGCS